jgi:Flp pilus assembly protein TadD
MQEAHSSLGLAYLQAGQAEKAVRHLKAALPLDQDGSLHFQLARAYQGVGNEEEARRVLAKSQQLREAMQADSHQARQEFTILPP